MKTTCSILLFLFGAVVSGRKLPESAEGVPEKCAGPFDATNTTFYKTVGVGAAPSCETFRAKELPMDEALGLGVRLISPPTTSNETQNLLKELIVSALAPSKACLLGNRSGKGTTLRARQVKIANVLNAWKFVSTSRPLPPRGVQFVEVVPADPVGGSEQCLPWRCSALIGRRRRHLKMVTTTQGEDGKDGEVARGPASDGLDISEDGEGQTALTACNDRCCVAFFVKEKNVDAIVVEIGEGGDSAD